MRSEPVRPYALFASAPMISGETSARSREVDLEEQQRLSLLAELGVLDTEPEPGFDALAHAAATLTHCPIALLSVVDRERQWFKARVGLEETQTPRELSFCSEASGRSA